MSPPGPPPTASPTTSASTGPTESPTTSASTEPTEPTGPTEPTRRPRVAVGGYLVMMLLLCGAGWLVSRPGARPRLIPRWLWWALTGMYGQAFWATAVLLSAGAATDAIDGLLAAGRRPLARMLVMAAIAALAALAVVAALAHLYLVAAAAALMGVVGSLPRRAFPGLPRAKARTRRD